MLDTHLLYRLIILQTSYDRPHERGAAGKPFRGLQESRGPMNLNV